MGARDCRAFVLTTRGGDFDLHIGQDVSIGYLSHTDAAVRLYLQETFTFLLLNQRGCRRVGSSRAGEADLTRGSDSSHTQLERFPRMTPGESEKISTLCQELDRMAARRIMERRLARFQPCILAVSEDFPEYYRRKAN
jgi:hypothetical protein